MGKVATVNPFLGMAGGRSSKRRGGEWFSALVVTTTSGTIDAAASDPIEEARFTVTKTAAKTGRYTITLPDKYRKFCGGFVTILGPDDANIGANTKGLDAFFKGGGSWDLNSPAGSMGLRMVM